MRNFVYLIIFISFFDLFSQLPVMSPYAQSLGATPFIIGIAVGIYSFSNTIGNVLSGFMTDRRGPFMILVLGLFASAISLFLYGIVSDPISLLGVRFVHGFMEGLIVPAAFTFLANRADESKRGSSVAVSGAFVGLCHWTRIRWWRENEHALYHGDRQNDAPIIIAAFFILRSFTYTSKNNLPTKQLPSV